MKIILCHVRRKLWERLIAIALVIGLLWGVPQFLRYFGGKRRRTVSELTEPLPGCATRGRVLPLTSQYFD